MSRIISVKLISLLSMSSLMMTAYILIFIPNTRTNDGKVETSQQKLQSESSPVRKYIGYLNGGLSILIAIDGFGFKGKKGVHEGFWLLCFLPAGRSPLFDHSVHRADCLAVSFSVIVLARRLMLSVDVSELEKLKYPYKGA